MSFVHLHVHSEYSLSSSLLRIDDMVKRAAGFGMPAVALTDRGNLYGALYLQKACKGTKVGEGEAQKPMRAIYGLDLAVRVDGGGELSRNIVLLAENLEGWRNLNRLTTAAHTRYNGIEEGRAPWVPLDFLLENNAGLIALTGGLKGIINTFLLQDQEALALETLRKLRAGFGENNLFLELVDSSLSLQRQCNEKLLEWSKTEGLPIVAASDVYYASLEDAFAQEVWMMVSQKVTLEENPRSSLVGQEHFFRSPEEMREAFSHLPEACDNTLKIAERCNVKISFSDETGKRIYHLPTIDLDVKGRTLGQDEAFAELSREGLEQRLKDLEITDEAKQKIYRDRLEYEIQVITKMGFCGYYLIVSDFIRWAKNNGCPVGPGRGSGAGSLAAYVLDITNIDPIAYNLLFERFLNPERVSLPDFDVDFCQAKRGAVIRYVIERYGQERVSQIVTFAKEQSKNALKDVGRVLGLSFAETNRLTKLIPVFRGKPATIQEALDEVPEFKELVDADPRCRQTVDIALKLEGALRQPGVHAAGVIIASKPVEDCAPLSRDVNGNMIVQWDMKMSEEAGLVKFDFLGLVTLDLLDMACRFIHERADREGRPRPEIKGRDLNYENIPLDEPRAFDLCTRGDTMGVFQFESGGMQQLCKRVRPDKFAEISAITSLFRPGPLESGMVEDFINRKFGKAKVEYMFPEMEAPLKETYGTILYQEQVLEIARRVSGFSLGGADMLRRAMGKKIEKEMAAQRAAFVDGAVKNGKPAAKASELFDLIEKFAGYGFNKSHADAYSVLTLQTAYLKAVYPTEFFAALLAIEKGDTEKVAKYIQDARQRNLEVLPPDVNESGLDFTIIRDGVIRFGLSAIKNVGEGAAEAILVGRKEGPFKDFFDFLSRVDAKALNKRTVECLIQAGALDFAETDKTAYRSKLLGILEKAVEWSGKLHESRNEGQFSLFGGGGGEGPAQDMPPPRFDPNAVPLTQRQILDFEKQLLGVFVSGSPMDKYLDRARRAGALAIEQLVDRAPKSYVTVAGIVVEFREVRVKKGRMAGELMAILKIEDPSGQVEVVSFPAHYKEFAEIFKSGNPLLMKAELDFEEDRPKLICSVGKNGQEGSRIEDLTLIEDRAPKKLALTLALDRVDGLIPPHLICEEIAEVLRKHHGPIPVSMTLVKTGHFETKMDLGETYKVHAHEALYEELRGVVAIPGGLRVDAVY